MESSSLWAAVDCAMQILANADPLEGLYNRFNRLKNALDNIEKLEGLASLTDQDEMQALKTKKLLITEEINSVGEKVRHCEVLLQQMSHVESDTQSNHALVLQSVRRSEQEEKPVEAVEQDIDVYKKETPTSTHLRHRQRPGGDWQVSPDPDSLARSRRKEHEDLTLDLVHMARRLKQNNLALNELVQRDKKVVDEADLALSVNAGKFKEQHRNLQAFASKSWATTWRLIVLAFFVVASIIGFFVLILVTRSR